MGAQERLARTRFNAHTESLHSDDGDFQEDTAARPSVAAAKRKAVEPPHMQLDDLAGIRLSNNAETAGADQELMTSTTDSKGDLINFGRIFPSKSVADAVVRQVHSPMCMVRAARHASTTTS